MTIKQLIKRLQELPSDYVVYQESAPWGSLYEVRSVDVHSIYDQKTKKWVPSGKKIATIEHGVGH